MAKYRITAPDGQKYDITAPDDATEDQVMAYARERFGKQEAPKAAPADPPKRTIGRRAIDTVKAPFEAAMTIGSGAVAQPLSGIAGLLHEGAGRVSQAFGGAGTAQGAGADTVRTVQQALTYQPRGEEGRRLVDIATYPFQKLEEGAHAAGGAVSDMAGPEAGTVANVTLQAIPMMIAGGLSRMGSGRRAAAQPQPTANPQQAAQAKVQQAGLDWNALGADMQNRITRFAEDATSFEATSPEALARMVRGRSLEAPITMTKGQASREPGQLRAEENIAQTTQGRAVRERHDEQNRALIENLEILKGKQKSAATTPEQVGASVAGEKGALTLAERRSDLNINRLYNDARKKGEMAAPVNVAPLRDFIKTHEDPTKIAFATDKLDALAKKPDAFGYEKLSLNELEGIRRSAATRARTSTDGTERHYAGELVRKIDEIIPDDAGGKAYQAARAARKEHAMQFEEPRAVSQLITDRTRTDRQVALEDVGRKILSGSIADLQTVKTRLLDRSQGPEQLAAGVQAWRDVRGYAIDHIREAATKGVATDAKGNQVLNAGALKRAVDEIGDRKLDMLLGPADAQKVRNIVKTAQDVKTLPPYKGGSTTVPNLLTTLLGVLEKASSHVPVGGNLVRGTVGKIRGVAEEGASAKSAAEALRDPLSGQAQANLPRRNRSPSRISPAVPLSDIGGQQQ